MFAWLDTAEVRATILPDPVFGQDGPPWLLGVFEHPENGERHAIPTWDFSFHAFDMQCACGPVLDDHDVVVHNPFDGRDHYENGRRKRN